MRVLIVMEMRIVQHAKPAAMDIGVNGIVLLDVEIMYATRIWVHVQMAVYPATIRIQMTHAVGAPLDVLSALVQAHVLYAKDIITGVQDVNIHVITVQNVANRTAVRPAVMMDIICNTTTRKWVMNVNGVNRGLALPSVDKDFGEVIVKTVVLNVRLTAVSVILQRAHVRKGASPMSIYYWMA